MGWINHLCIMNMKRRRTRTILTIMGVAIGVVSVVSLLAIGIGVKKEIINTMVDSGSITKINVYSTSSGTNKNKLITNKKIKAFQELATVKNAYPVYTVFADIEYGKYQTYTEIIGLPQAELDKLDVKTNEASKSRKGLNPTLIIGNQFSKIMNHTITEKTYSDMEKKTSESLLGKELSVNISGGDNMVKLSVDAVINGKEDEYNEYSQCIYCDLDKLIALMKRESQGELIPDQPVDANGNPYTDFIYSYAVVEVEGIDDVDAMVKRLQDMGFQTENPKEYIDTVQHYLKIVEILLGCIGMIALVVAVIGISNTMTTSVYDRINEIGVLKVLGCDPDELNYLFLYEAGIMGAAGGVLGVAISWGVRIIIDKLAASLFDLNKGIHIAIIPWWLTISAIAGSIVLAVLAGYFPARKASKLPPIDAVTSR